MNGIQKYLIETALDAAHEAAGMLISTSKLSPVLVAQSLEEFKQAIKDMDEKIVSKVPCNFEYRGRKVTKQQSSAGGLVIPIFFQPSDKI